MMMDIDYKTYNMEYTYIYNHIKINILHNSLNFRLRIVYRIPNLAAAQTL